MSRECVDKEKRDAVMKARGGRHSQCDQEQQAGEERRDLFVDATRRHRKQELQEESAVFDVDPYTYYNSTMICYHINCPTSSGGVHMYVILL